MGMDGNMAGVVAGVVVEKFGIASLEFRVRRNDALLPDFYGCYLLSRDLVFL